MKKFAALSSTVISVVAAIAAFTAAGGAELANGYTTI